MKQKFAKYTRQEPGNCDQCGKDFKQVNLGPNGLAYSYWAYYDMHCCSKQCLTAEIGEEQSEWDRLLKAEGL